MPQCEFCETEVEEPCECLGDAVWRCPNLKFEGMVPSPDFIHEKKDECD